MKLSACKAVMSKWLWIVLAAFLCLPTMSKAQAGFSDNELDTLVSTIALYPDPLLVHVLTAATYGDQIAPANAWAQAHKDLDGQALATAMENANLSYDPSVQALIPFPTVLATMAKYTTWADQLGDAVSFQKDKVLDAIQRMRQTAYNYGHLKTDDQVTVTKNERIEIEPTNTEYVYVPVYNPHVVYYVYADHYHPAVVYHHHAWLGDWYGEWGWGTCWFDWNYHYIYIRDYRWYPHRNIPHHPRHYKPAPRKREPAKRYDAPAPRKQAEPARRDDRRNALMEALKERRAQGAPARENVQRNESRNAPASANEVHSRAASAKSNNYSVVNSNSAPKASRSSSENRVENGPTRDQVRRPSVQQSKPSQKEERTESRSSSRRESSSYSEPRRSSNSSSRSDDQWQDNSRRSSSGTSARSRSNDNGGSRPSAASASTARRR